MAYQSLSKEDRAARFAAVALLHVGFAAVFVSLGGVDVIKAQFDPPIKVTFEKLPVPPVVEDTPVPDQTIIDQDPFITPPIIDIEYPPINDTQKTIKTSEKPADDRIVIADPVVDPTPKVLPVEPVRIAASFDPRYSDQVQPPYPGLARAMGEHGRVTITVQIDELGRVTSVALDQSSGSSTLDEAAMRYAKKYWRFKPATVDGKAVISSVKRSILFKLDTQRG
jgi:periplasmic protein TonB